MVRRSRRDRNCSLNFSTRALNEKPLKYIPLFHGGLVWVSSKYSTLRILRYISIVWLSAITTVILRKGILIKVKHLLLILKCIPSCRGCHGSPRIDNVPFTAAFEKKYPHKVLDKRKTNILFILQNFTFLALKNV